MEQMNPNDQDQLSIRLGEQSYQLALTIYSLRGSNGSIADETARIREQLREAINQILEANDN